MRKALALLITVFLLAACSGGDDSGSSPVTGADGGGNATTDDGGSDGSGQIDCDTVIAALSDVGVPVQLMAQVRDPENLAAIKEGTVGNLDIDAFLAAIDVLHALDSFDGPLGDPKASLDAFEEAGTEMKALLEADAPTQADIDAYNETIGPVPDFLGQQTAIAGGLDAANC